MDFSLSSQQLMTQKMVSNFAQKEVAPIIKEFDRKQEPIPWVLKRMGELGILGLPFPVRYGGGGVDYLLLGLGCGEPEAVDTPLARVTTLHPRPCAMPLFQRAEH